MNKRLEEINNRTEFVEWEKGDIRAVVKSEDYSYLEEQAERVEELESRTANEEHYIVEIMEQNKQYRNYIEYAIEESRWGNEGTALDRVVEILRGVLERTHE